MARGLSDLQKWILKKASEQKIVYYADICIGYYGWIPLHDFNEDGTIKSSLYHHFSRSSIGEKVYRKTMAAISKSCMRLQERGFVVCLQGKYGRWSGVRLETNKPTSSNLNTEIAKILET